MLTQKINVEIGGVIIKDVATKVGDAIDAVTGSDVCGNIGRAVDKFTSSITVHIPML